MKAHWTIALDHCETVGIVLILFTKWTRRNYSSSSIKSVISTEYVQKESCFSPLALDLWWELWKWLPLWFLSAFQTSATVSLSVWFWQQIFEQGTKLCHQIPTHSFTSEGLGAKRHLHQFQWVYWKGRVGRTRLMALTLSWQIKFQ